MYETKPWVCQTTHRGAGRHCLWNIQPVQRMADRQGIYGSIESIAAIRCFCFFSQQVGPLQASPPPRLLTRGAACFSPPQPRTTLELLAPSRPHHNPVPGYYTNHNSRLRQTTAKPDALHACCRQQQASFPRSPLTSTHTHSGTSTVSSPALANAPLHQSPDSERPYHIRGQITLLFMYLYDRSPVLRHLPPLTLQSFRIPRKPSSPNISSIG